MKEWKAFANDGSGAERSAEEYNRQTRRSERMGAEKQENDTGETRWLRKYRGVNLALAIVLGLMVMVGVGYGVWITLKTVPQTGGCGVVDDNLYRRLADNMIGFGLLGLAGPAVLALWLLGLIMPWLRQPMSFFLIVVVWAGAMLINAVFAGVQYARFRRQKRLYREAAISFWLALAPLVLAVGPVILLFLVHSPVFRPF